MEGKWIEILLVLSQAILGWVLWQQQKGNQGHEVRIADMESKRENARADDANMATALQLATLLATTLNPLKEAIDNLTASSDRVLEKNDNYLALFTQKADEMHAVTVRRDQEREADRTHHDAQHQEIINRLERQQKQLEILTKEVKVRDLPPQTRGEISRLVLLASNIGADVKTILKNTQGPGESNAPEPEVTEVINEEKQA